MKRVLCGMLRCIYTYALVAMAFTACKKDDVYVTPAETGEPNPHTPVERIEVKVQAVITVGAITYDSIPAEFHITTWDEGNRPYEQDTMLSAGVNTISLPKAHSRYRFIMEKWGVHDSVTLRKSELQQDVVYTLGGRKEAKKLRKEESSISVMDTY